MTTIQGLIDKFTSQWRILKCLSITLKSSNPQKTKQNKTKTSECIEDLKNTKKFM